MINEINAAWWLPITGAILFNSVDFLSEGIDFVLQRRQVLDLSFCFLLRKLQFFERVDDGSEVFS